MLGTFAIPIGAAFFGAPLKMIGVINILMRLVRNYAKTQKVFQLGMFFAPSVRPLYDESNLHRANLSRLLEDTGTAFAPVVPWSVTGAFCAGTLNVPTLDYILYSPITYGAQLFLLLYIIIDFRIATKGAVITKQRIIGSRTE